MLEIFYSSFKGINFNMESFDLADVLARLRVSHDHRVDHDPAKVVQHADEEANLTGIKKD